MLWALINCSASWPRSALNLGLTQLALSFRPLSCCQLCFFPYCFFFFHSQHLMTEAGCVLTLARGTL